MYKKVSTDLKFNERELSVLEFWEKNRIFEKLSIDTLSGLIQIFQLYYTKEKD